MLQAYCHTRLKLIRHHWKAYLLSRQPEALHQMRVETKRLTALFHFIEGQVKKFNSKKELRFLRRSFKLSGRLRDGGNFQLLSAKFRYQPPAASAQQQAYNTEVNFTQLQQRYGRSRRKFKAIEKAARRQLRQIPVPQLHTHVMVLLTSVAMEIHRGLKREDLHELRKKLKEAYYLQKLLPGKYNLPLPTVKWIDELQDSIGNWHDLEKFEKDIPGRGKAARAALLRMRKEEQKLLAGIMRKAAFVDKL